MMTVNAEIQCDGNGCGTTRTLDDSSLAGFPDIDLPPKWIERHGFHYCAACRVEVEQEEAGEFQSSDSGLVHIGDGQMGYA